MNLDFSKKKKKITMSAQRKRIESKSRRGKTMFRVQKQMKRTRGA